MCVSGLTLETSALKSYCGDLSIRLKMSRPKRREQKRRVPLLLCSPCGNPCCEPQSNLERLLTRVLDEHKSSCCAHVTFSLFHNAMECYHERKPSSRKHFDPCVFLLLCTACTCVKLGLTVQQVLLHLHMNLPLSSLRN